MRLIFVGGCERSGTTLVQKILTSHSRIAGGPEFVFTGRIADLYRRMTTSYPGPYATRLEAFYDDEELAAAFRSFYGSFFRRLIEGKPGALYLSEKTPSNIFAAPQLLKIFPDSFFVHVIRDGRGVLASHRQVRKRLVAAGDETYNRATFRTRHVCGRWNRAIETHLELRADRDVAGRVVEVRFEDLLLEPERILSRLFQHLSLELEDTALAPEKITAQQAGIPVDGYWTTEEMVRQRFNPRKIDRWRQSLPRVTQVLGNLLMADNLRRLSYPVGDSYLPANRALCWLHRRLN